MDLIENIFQLAGWVLVKSKDADAAVDGVEQRIGTRLPDTFRNLLLLDNGLDFLGKHSNADWPIPYSALGSTMGRWDSYNPLKRDEFRFVHSLSC
jgi:hypothetical protein